MVHCVYKSYVGYCRLNQVYIRTQSVFTILKRNYSRYYQHNVKVATSYYFKCN